MPSFTIREVVLDLHRDAVMLDTNVVYAAFSTSDSRHRDCLAFLDLAPQFLLTLPVIVETWGLLVGRDGNWEAGFEFLGWINNPSSGTVVVNHAESMDKIQELARSVHVDCVDATILYLAHEISNQCSYAPGFAIATYDVADFLRSLKSFRFKLRIIDLRSLDEIDLS